MWIKLGNEHLNLSHVVRVRFNKGWKNGQDELVAELEGFVKGEIQVFTRYRGRDAEVLQVVLQNAGRLETQAARVPEPVGVAASAAAPFATSASNTNTLHDI